MEWSSDVKDQSSGDLKSEEPPSLNAADRDQAYVVAENLLESGDISAEDMRLKLLLQLLGSFLLVTCDEFEGLYADWLSRAPAGLDFKDTTSSPIWRRVMIISQALPELVSICTQKNTELTMTLSLHQTDVVKRCIGFTTEYGASLLERYYAHVISEEQLERKLWKEIWEESQLPFSLKMKRLGFLAECFIGIAMNSSEAFRILVSSTPQLYILSILLQFLHHPIEDLSQEEVADVIKLRREIRPGWENSLFKQLAVEDLAINLLYLIQNPDGYVQNCCKDYLYKISITENGFKSLAIGLLQKFELPRVCTVMSTVVTIQLEVGVRELKLDNVLSSLASQAVSMCTDLTTKNGLSLATVGITACLVMCDKYYPAIDIYVWQPLLKPLIILGKKSLSSDSVVSIQDVSNCLSLAKLLATLPEPFHRKFLNFQTFWNILFANYVAAEKYLGKMVNDMNSVSLVEKFRTDLQSVLYIIVLQAYRADRNMGEYCVDMIINWKRSIKEVDPIILELLDHDSTLIVQCAKIVEDPKRTLYVAFQDSSKSLFRAIVQEAKHNRSNKTEAVTLLSSICTQLLAYESKSQLSARDAELAEQLRNSCIKSESTNKTQLVRLLDLKDEVEYRKYVSTLLLAEFGSCEDLIDEFLQLEGGKDASLYVTLLFKRLGTGLEEYESNPNLKSMEFDFSKSVVFALEMLSTLCEATYDETTNLKKEKHELASLCSWNQLETFVPFVTKLRNTKVKDLVALGIPDKCQDVLSFIATKGRGVERKGVNKVSGIQNILFRISSPEISVKVSGLVDLKKRIEKKDPEILSNQKIISQLCQEEMENEDPYVFMHAINVLVVLGGQNHESLLPKIIEEYGFGEEHPWATRLSTTEQFALRLKLGEALVKLLKFIGAAAVKYRTPVLNVCFRLANQQDPMVRESALVVLGDLCYSLELSVQTVIVQVWHSIETSLQTEKEPSVIRAHFALTHKCLQGVSRFITPETAMDTTLGEFIRDVQRRVKLYYDSASDPVVRLHCQLCLDELREIAVKLLTPQTDLKYRIRVLQ